MRFSMSRKLFLTKLAFLILVFLSIAYYMSRWPQKARRDPSENIYYSNKSGTVELSQWANTLVEVSNETSGRPQLAKSCMKNSTIVTFPGTSVKNGKILVPAIGYVTYLSRSNAFGWICLSNGNPESIFVHMFIKNHNISMCFQTYHIDVQSKGDVECKEAVKARFNVSFPDYFPVFRNVTFELFVQIQDQAVVRAYFHDAQGMKESMWQTIHGEKDDDSQRLALIQHRRPIPLCINDNDPTRLNIIIPGFSKYLTGGPLSIFHFAIIAVKSGFKVRFLLTEKGELDSKSLGELLKTYDSLGSVGRDIEFISNIYGKSDRISVNSNDLMMATLYSTVFPAHNAAKVLKNPNILYFIQDYEPLFFPQDENWLEAYESYIVPHFAIFSTPLLQKYFQFRKESIYAWCENKTCDDYGWAAQPAISAHQLVNKNMAKNIGMKRLIAYLRPHSPRNAFGLVVEALSESVKQGIFQEDTWELFGIGATSNVANECNLGGKPNFCIHIVHHLNEESYKDFILTGDVGFSLMVSPHPSLPPLDFAAAGLITVTNSFATKTTSVLENISKNFIVVEPYLSSVVNGLRLAVERSENQTFRAEHAKLNWAQQWNDDRCYGKPLFDKVKKWFKYRQSIN